MTEDEHLEYLKTHHMDVSACTRIKGAYLVPRLDMKSGRYRSHEDQNLTNQLGPLSYFERIVPVVTTRPAFGCTITPAESEAPVLPYRVREVSRKELEDIYPPKPEEPVRESIKLPHNHRLETGWYRDARALEWFLYWDELDACELEGDCLALGRVWSADGDTARDEIRRLTERFRTALGG